MTKITALLAAIKLWFAASLPTAKAFIVAQKKWFILAVAVISVWVVFSLLLHKKPVHVVPAPAPIVYVAPAKVAPCVTTAPHKRVVHHTRATSVPAPVATCQFLFWERPCQ